MNPATARTSSRAQKRAYPEDDITARDLASIDFLPCPLLQLADDGLRRRWERIALGDRA